MMMCVITELWSELFVDDDRETTRENIIKCTVLGESRLIQRVVEDLCLEVVLYSLLSAFSITFYCTQCQMVIIIIIQTCSALIYTIK